MLAGLGTVIAAFFAWMCIDVKYILEKRGLKVQAGPIRAIIPYERITGVGPAKDTMGGFRIMLSPGGIQVYYDGGFFTDMKITPKDKAGFVRELKNRCPHIKVEAEKFHKG
ncbi:PH domain-containing protein [Alteribacter lacisalsi]|uniref:PH domain-containing protein n=1 Tax=Alteribacter lacisalsi TaxID=2045244 RepID=UPI001374BFAE|nr:PH domain-containing protein [Alteribacter lacisalsi]